MLLLLANATGQSKKADNDHTHKGVIVGLFHNSSTVGFAHSGSEMSIGEQLATGDVQPVKFALCKAATINCKGLLIIGNV
jgi:hypothetical protein